MEAREGTFLQAAPRHARRRPVVTNQEIIDTIRAKLDEKNEVIKEQQEMILELQTKLADVEAKYSALEALKTERRELISQISALD
jgi:hypothetical protein